MPITCSRFGTEIAAWPADRKLSEVANELDTVPYSRIPLYGESMDDIVGGLLKMLERLIGENIVLNWQPAPDLWPVKIDPSQLDQILVNLCVNARDAIQSAGVVTIETDTVVIDEQTCAAQEGLHPSRSSAPCSAIPVASACSTSAITRVTSASRSDHSRRAARLVPAVPNEATAIRNITPPPAPR